MRILKPTITVAISAYNEEDNILNFLRSVLMQKENGFILKQIWVHSDGSTDNTVNLIKSLKSKKIKIWDHKKRVGKSTWLNKIYSELDTDFLVQSDADVVMGHKLVISDLIKPLVKNKNVGMCGGNPTPLKGNSFWEKMVNTAFEPYQDFRRLVKGGNNVFSAVGQILAYRNEFVKKISVPVDMVTNDLYTYFCCITLGWKFSYVKSAIVRFQPPRTLNDLLRQNTRFHAGHNRMFNYFSEKLINDEMKIPKLLYLKVILMQFLRHPFLSISYFLINNYTLIKAFKMGSNLTAKWPIAVTTKNLVGKLRY